MCVIYSKKVRVVYSVATLKDNEKLEVLVKKQRAEVLKLQGSLEKSVSAYNNVLTCGRGGGKQTLAMWCCQY